MVLLEKNLINLLNLVIIRSILSDFMKIPRIDKIKDNNTEYRYNKYSKDLHFSVIKEYLFNDVSQKEFNRFIIENSR